jgi:hypothetical protein
MDLQFSVWAQEVAPPPYAKLVIIGDLKQGFNVIATSFFFRILILFDSYLDMRGLNALSLLSHTL